MARLDLKMRPSKKTGWPRRDWNSKHQNHWRYAPVEGDGQSSHDKWKNSKPESKWKEISLEMDALGSTMKEKTHTWNKSCKESARRETELYKMKENATKDEKQEDTKRNIIKKTLKQLQDEADEARTLLDDMQQKVDEADAKSRKPNAVFIVKSTSTCTRGTQNLDDHTITWIKCGSRCKVTTPRR